jgi:hypothetical protein
MSSAFVQYLSNHKLLVGDSVETPDKKTDIETLQNQFLATLDSLRIAHKNVIVIAPPPGNGINIRECLERKAHGQFVVPMLQSDCSFSYHSYQAWWGRVIEFLRNLERLEHINVVWPESVTCNHENCAAQIDGTPIYLDGSHITYDASILLTRMLHIADKLDSTLAATGVGSETLRQTHF